MRNTTEQNITSLATDRFSKCPDPRLREVVTSLVKHLHGFIREVEPTEGEWFAGIDFLTRVGKMCDDKRQEFILMSDVLGVSILVDAINHRLPAVATPSTVVGPFHIHDSPDFQNGANMAIGAPGVPLVLTGTVRWSKERDVSRVRVTPELIDVTNESSKWSQPYDTVLSNVFEVQAGIASRVAQALNVALAAPVQERIARPPTASLDAYDEFLKGEQITKSLGTSDGITLTKGLEHYERAVVLDSTFAQAWSAVARANALNAGTSPTKESVERAKVAAQRALALAGDRAEGPLAMGSYLQHVALDYSGARTQYLEGLKRDASNADLLVGLATLERVLGRFDDALNHARQAQLVDPRSVATARRVAGALHDLRRYPEELAAWDRALALAPDNLGLIQGKAFGYLSMGALDSVHALVEQKLKIVDTTALLARFSIYQETMWTLPPSLWPKILKLTVADFGGDKGHWGLKLGHTYRLLGDSARARAFGDTALAAFEAQLKDFPERAQLRELRGRALALGGHRAEAIAEADRSLKLRETSLDASIRPYVHFQVARILIQSGEYERALDLIEPLLTTPASDVTPEYLRIDPTFKPLFGNARFDRMAKRTAP